MPNPKKPSISYVEMFNNKVKIGTLVNYLDDAGESHSTRTRSEASILGGHTAVIWIEGKAGCVRLDRVHTLD